ncbi:MAG: hypothetical protein AAGG55_16265 [Pseudomonadota bacterium]
MDGPENTQSAAARASVDSKAGRGSSRDKSASAALASAVIIVGFVVYWVSEIDAVREMLKLAYG